MFQSKLHSLLSVAALGLGLAASAGAATTFSTTGTLPAGSTWATFGSSLSTTTALGGTWSGTGSSGTAGASSSTLLDPLSGAGNYAYAGGGGTVTATFATPLTSLWILWGSPDTFNSLTINGTTYTASQVTGLVLDDATTQYVNVTGVTGGISSVSFSSSLPSFEFSVLAPTTGTPEPSSVALMMGGLLAAGIGIIRRRK